jgi:hypothetical protein
MEECGIKVTRNPAEMGKLTESALRHSRRVREEGYWKAVT